MINRRAGVGRSAAWAVRLTMQGEAQTAAGGGGGAGDWRARLDAVERMMREMSSHTDPQAMVRSYGQRVREIQPNDGFIAVSRRGLASPGYKITRASSWTDSPDPWKEPHRFPVHTRGVLGELIYGDKPRLIQDFRCEADDPAYDLLKDALSLAVIPQYDNGIALNMVVIIKKTPGGFDPERFPEVFWQSNLFGRATSNLVLRRQVEEAYASIDRELRVVADIQRSLLPSDLPGVLAGVVDVATHYQPSKNAGGDYFDFFRYPSGHVGVLIADVSGHGTPAAVLMAILHAMAHVNDAWVHGCEDQGGQPGAAQPMAPSEWLGFINHQLCERYTRLSGTFVTAFYALYDPRAGTLTYASAGHNPPRLRMERTEQRMSVLGASPGDEGALARVDTPVLALDQAQGLPLGIVADAAYADATIDVRAGDVLCLYTDGITETFSRAREMYGTERLDEVLRPARATAAGHLGALLEDVERFGQGQAPADDRTVLVLRLLEGARQGAGR
jgi:sigma-B regulation protein RsbU (phosphoserine phosphatase)